MCAEHHFRASGVARRWRQVHLNMTNNAPCALQEKGYVTADVAEKEGLHQLKLSGTKFRQMLRAGGDIPEWFAFKSVVRVLREANTAGN